MEGTSEGQETQKKSPFDNLSREDLILKCKNLLLIAQKAKQAKDDALEEIKNLKEIVSKHEIQKNADKDSLKAMQEIVERLTSDKLSLANDIEGYKRKIIKIEKQINDNKNNKTIEFLETEATIKNDEIKALQDRISALDKELLEYRNKKEESDVEKFEVEEKFVVLEEQLQEKSSIIEKLELTVKSLQTEIDHLHEVPKSDEESVEKLRSEVFVLNEKIILLENENSNNLEVLEQLKTAKDELEQECAKLRNQVQDLSELDLLKAELEKYKNMNKTLQSQLQDCFETRSAKTKECEELEQLTKEYESMKKDKEKENENLKKENQQKDFKVTELKSMLDECNKELESKLNEISQLNVELEGSIRRQTLMKAEESEQINDLNRELESLRLEKEEEIDSLRMDLENITKELEHKTKEMEIMKTSLEILHNKNQELSIKSMQEIETFKKELSEAKQSTESVLNENDSRYKLKLDEFEKEVNTLRTELTHTQSLLCEKNEKIVELEKIVDDVNKKSEELAFDSNKELDQYKTKLADLQSKLDAQIVERQNESQELQQKLQNQQQDIQREENKTITELQARVQELNDLLQIKESESLSLKTTLEEYKVNLGTLSTKRDEEEKNQKLIVDLENTIQVLKSELQSKDMEIDSYKICIEDLKSSHANFATGNTEELNKLKTEMNRIQEEHVQKVEELLKENEQNKLLIKEKVSELETSTNKLSIFKQENMELLEELKEINQILKERGEVISIQMSKISQLEQEKENIEGKLSESLKHTIKIEDYEKEVNNWQTTIKNMEAKLQENQNTIKKLMEDSHTEKDKSHNELQTDTLSTSTISKVEESTRMKDIEDSFEEKYNKIRFLAVKLKKKVAEQATIITKLESNQKQEMGSNITVNTIDGSGTQIIQKENENLKVALDAKEKIIKENTETIETLQSELNKAKATVKKTSVLSLEMESYEKSLSELSKKLDEKKSQAKDLETTIDTQASTINSLKEQIVFLEENLASEKAHAIDLKQQIDQQQLKQRESDQMLSKVKNELQALQSENEQIKLDLEDSKIELAKIVAEKEKFRNNLENDTAKYIKTGVTLQEKIDSLSKTLEEKDIELQDLKTEYASYKVRAQSVLKQNQTKDVSRDKELEEEINALRISLQNSETKIELLQSENDDLLKNIAELEVSKKRIQARNDELINLLEEVRLENDSSTETYKKQLIEKEEATKSQKLQYETLRVCYEKQIQELVENHQKELDTLKLQNKILAGESHDNEFEEPIAPVLDPNIQQKQISFDQATTDEQKINLILMQREEGEGSENTSSYPPYRKSSSSKSKHDLIPLDELLNSSFDDNYLIEERPVSPTIELHQTKEKLTVQETRVKHLSSLLAEAEQDLAKLTQLNDVLKEEVRRQQRAIEREQHVHNSEYLKNVVIKFLTLNSGNERSRLVPVLNTILKLSPEETQQLQAVAKGNEGLARFTGILPIWSNNN